MYRLSNALNLLPLFSRSPGQMHIVHVGLPRGSTATIPQLVYICIGVGQLQWRTSSRDCMRNFVHGGADRTTSFTSRSVTAGGLILGALS